MFNWCILNPYFQLGNQVFKIDELLQKKTLLLLRILFCMFHIAHCLIQFRIAKKVCSSLGFQCHGTIQVTYSGLSNKRTLCVYLCHRKILHCAALFHSTEQYNDSPVRLFIFWKIPCPVRLLFHTLWFLDTPEYLYVDIFLHWTWTKIGIFDHLRLYFYGLWPKNPPHLVLARFWTTPYGHYNLFFENLPASAQ